MEQNRLTTDELRGMLDTYSPEQQMEEDAKAINEGANALTEAASLLQKCLDAIPAVAEQLNMATTLKISETSKANIIQTGAEIGEQTAKTFKENVKPVILQARKEVKHVSIPATAAYCMFFLIISLIVYMSITLLANHYLWQHDELWKMALYIFGGQIVLNAAIIFTCHKGWM